MGQRGSTRPRVTTSTRRSTRSTSRRRARPPHAAGSPYGAAPPSGIDGSGDRTASAASSSPTGLYRNWEFAHVNGEHANARSKCLFSQILPGLHDYYRPLPYGDNAVSVYTDESGEANVNYVPGLGYYFDNLAQANKNLNGGCDLENVDPIGTATIDVVGEATRTSR